jgi:hypothetical protein
MELCNQYNDNLILHDEMSSLLYDEDRIIEDVITTPFEKVLRILSNLTGVLTEIGKINHYKTKLPKDILNIMNSINLKEALNDLTWVIKRIQSHQLYTYEITEDDDYEKMKQESPEMQSFLEMLSDYSEVREIKRRNKMAVSQTMKLKDRPVFLQKEISSHKVAETPSAFMKRKREMRLLEMSRDYKRDDSLSISPNVTGLKFNNDDMSETLDVLTEIKEEEKNDEYNKLDSITAIRKMVAGGKIEGTEMNLGSPLKTIDYDKNIDLHTFTLSLHQLEKDSKHNSKKNLSELKLASSNNNLVTIPQLKLPNLEINQVPGFQRLSSTAIKQHNIDPKSIISKDFNIHEFDSTVGRVNTLPFIGRTIYTAFDLMSLIDTEKLDSFLSSIQQGYIEKVQYHNSVHASDVMQTIATWVMNSNIEDISNITDMDELAILTAAMAHDIGHPGTNNGFQINTYSDYAIFYNDQSVLENFHSSTFFRIARQPQNNIFCKFSEPEYKQFRKRVIQSILATDMIQHAKILSMVKSKVASYKETLKRLAEANQKIDDVPLISKDSSSLYDEQQGILDFIVHTADLSHNSKSFKISYKWTEFLMDEFWQQGDTEKSLGVPVSFLCDRMTADVPKSQIGFIKGIILPTFDVLIDLMPGVGYLKEQIDTNLEEWNKIVDDKKPTLIFAKSPRFNKSPSHNQGQQNKAVNFTTMAGLTGGMGKRLSLPPTQPK